MEYKYFNLDGSPYEIMEMKYTYFHRITRNKYGEWETKTFAYPAITIPVVIEKPIKESKIGVDWFDRDKSQSANESS